MFIFSSLFLILPAIIFSTIVSKSPLRKLSKRLEREIFFAYLVVVVFVRLLLKKSYEVLESSQRNLMVTDKEKLYSSNFASICFLVYFFSYILSIVMLGCCCPIFLSLKSFICFFLLFATVLFFPRDIAYRIITLSKASYFMIVLLIVFFVARKADILKSVMYFWHGNIPFIIQSSYPYDVFNMSTIALIFMIVEMINNVQGQDLSIISHEFYYIYFAFYITTEITRIIIICNGIRNIIAWQMASALIFTLNRYRFTTEENLQ